MRGHGRKSGWIRHLKAKALLHMKRLVPFARPSLPEGDGRLIFVCKGNIARSAYAEARAKKLGFESAVSAGLRARTGAPADSHAIEAAVARGLDLSSHRARAMGDLNVLPTDRIFTFEVGQARELENRYPGQVSLIGILASGKRPHIEDPFGLSAEYFQECFAVIDQCLDALVRLRRGPAVYIDQAEALGSIALIRALGAAGYEVHAASESSNTVGARSRYAFKSPIHPSVDSPEFVDWLRNYLDQNRIQALIPSERLVLALGDHLEEFHPLIPFGSSPSELRRAFSKHELFASALDQGLEHGIPSVRLMDFDSGDERRHGVLRFPVFIKTDAVHARAAGTKGGVTRALNETELDSELKAVARRFTRAVVQSFVPGVGIGACFVVWDGVPVAEFLHRRLHEVPYTGGISSWRAEFHHDGIRQNALNRLKALGWRGPAMVEYRWDEATDSFALMELNSRFWGSLHLPYYAGVDFPAVLLTHFFAGLGVSAPLPRRSPPRRSTKISCRHLPAELQHLWSKIKSRDLGLAAKIRAVARFFVLAADPGVRSDLGSFPGDRFLFFIGMWKFAGNVARALAARGAHLRRSLLGSER